MNKRTVKIIALLACSCLTLSFITGCVQPNGQNSLSSDVSNIEEVKDYEYGTHIFKVGTTDKDFIRDGVCNYTIVYPTASSEYENTAVSEFSAIFEMATDLRLPTRTDNGLTHNASAKYISIGNTSLLESSGIDKELDDLGRDGCKVVSKDDTIYIFGGEEGVMYGVYTFMSETFHYEYYYEDTIEIDKNVTNLKLKTYDIKDVPDLQMRWIGWNKLSRKETDDELLGPTRFRMRYQRGSNMIDIHERLGDGSSATGGTHNCSECLPESEYKEEHPNWYSNKGGNQLCWSAGCKPQDFDNGNIPAEFEAMAQAISLRIQASLKIYTPEEYPEKDAFCLGMEDNTYLCSCNGCSAFKEKYGTESAPAVVLLNRVAEITDEWMAQEENEPYRRDMNYLFLAYLTFEPAPVKYDAVADRYVPIDELVTPNHNVGVYLAMIASFDYQLSINHEMNAKGKETIDSWTDIGYVAMWLYQINYSNFFLPYDSFNFFNDGLKYVISEGTKGLIVQGATSTNVVSHTSFGGLKLYLESKLMWNVNLDINELIDDWFNATFKEGAADMKQMFFEIRAWQAHVLDKYDMYLLRSMFTDMYETKHWTLSGLRSWMSLCDSALEKVEKYKTSDPTRYETIKNHIGLEWMSPAYLLLRIYSKDLSSEDRNSIIARFSEIADVMKVEGVAEGNGTVSDFLATVA